MEKTTKKSTTKKTKVTKEKKPTAKTTASKTTKTTAAKKPTVAKSTKPTEKKKPVSTPKSKTTTSKTSTAKVVSTKKNTTAPKKASKEKADKKTSAQKTNKVNITNKTPVASSRTTTEKKPTSKMSVQSPSKLIKKMSPPFEVDEYVFYPNEGIGRIIGTEDRMLEGEMTAYYIIEFPLQKMINRIPIKNCKKVKLRKVVTASKGKNTLKVFDTKPQKTELSWKDRLLMYQEINGRGNIIEMAEMLASLFVRRKTRNNLSFQERQVYDFALEAISSELAIVFNTSHDEVQSDILTRLEKNYFQSLSTE